MHPKKQKIAIIGSGISGLGAAFMLHEKYDIRVYEKNAYAGGHSRTVDVKTDSGLVPVDTGFIVFNHRTYPLLTALFKHLDVPTAKSDMSFGASINESWLEYSTDNIASIFAQKRNLIKPQFLRMVWDILTFDRKARKYMDAPSSLTLGECLDQIDVGPWFKQFFILAMGGAIWSTPVKQIMEFPARNFIQFFDNHGLLSIGDRPQWYFVKGGSREYVKRLIAPFQDSIKLSCGVTKVERTPDGVLVTDQTGQSERFDHVIFASAADQTLKMLQNPTSAETQILSNFSYLPNQVVLHSDVSFMPKRRRAWASWIYRSENMQDKEPNVSLSYWMNNLQDLVSDRPLIATLNPGTHPATDLVHDTNTFRHPVFDSAAIDAQKRIPEIQGVDRIWYCGAYQSYGFHEDGLRSAYRVAKALGGCTEWNQ